ncbi:hypothetical protein B566_EDAN008827, partial [Ephemera danica]
MKNYADALKLYEQTIEQGQELGNNRLRTLKCMIKKAYLLFQMKKYVEAIRTCDQVKTAVAESIVLAEVQGDEALRAVRVVRLSARPQIVRDSLPSGAHVERPVQVNVVATHQKLVGRYWRHHSTAKMAEMLCSHGCQEESGNILQVDEPQPGTSTQKPRNPKIYKQGSNKGGGGAASSHGLNFHLNTATLLLFRLREIHQTDPNFEFHIWLEKAGYEKLDDIVVRYKKSGGKWTEICVQCKHATEKIDENGTKYVSNLTAEDFLNESKNRKDFSLVEYFKSFKIIEDKNDEIERFYVLHSNRPFKKPKVESKYPYFDLLEYSEQTGETILDHFFPRRYKIKYASELLNKLHSNNGEILEDERDKTIQFCDKFIYVCDDRDLEKEISEKVAKHWKNNEEQKKILEARLHHLFWEMYQNKRDPDQTFLLNEFFKSIQFNVHRVHAHFAGRFKQIEEIKDALEREEKKHMFDLLVTGMAGMGKTQLVLQYIEKNKQNYKNIIWINAESKKSIEHCFDGIAKHCHLENDIKEIYFYLRDDTLFIFDNADKVLLSKNDLNKYLYLPNDAQCTERNKIIIISQENKWTASFIVNVDTFSEEDALEYLDGTIECSKEDKLKIAVTYQYWPLALCLAVSYIKSQPEVQLGLKSYSDIISTLQTDNTKLHKHSPEIREMESYNESLRSLWQLIRTKLESKDKLALKIVEIMSLSDPDNFPIALLKLVDICAEDQFYKENLGGNLPLYIFIVNEIGTLLQNVRRLEQLGPNDPDTLSSMNIKASALVSLGKYEEALSIYNSVLETRSQQLGLNHPDTIAIMNNKASVLAHLKKYEEVLRIFNQVIEASVEQLGSHHPQTLQSKSNKARVLFSMEKYEEALNICNQVLEARLEKWGPLHPDYLRSLDHKAIVLERIGKNKEALSIHNQVFAARLKEWGALHPDTIVSMNNKAVVLQKTAVAESIVLAEVQGDEALRAVRVVRLSARPQIVRDSLPSGAHVERPVQRHVALSEVAIVRFILEPELLGNNLQCRTHVERAVQERVVRSDVELRGASLVVKGEYGRQAQRALKSLQISSTFRRTNKFNELEHKQQSSGKGREVHRGAHLFAAVIVRLTPRPESDWNLRVSREETARQSEVSGRHAVELQSREMLNLIKLHVKNAGVDSSHGANFEWENTLLCYLECENQHQIWKRTGNSGVKSFYVANNVQGVGAFDDIVYRVEYVDEGLQSVSFGTLLTEETSMFGKIFDFLSLKKSSEDLINKSRHTLTLSTTDAME